jgi:hypothetical protein
MHTCTILSYYLILYNYNNILEQNVASFTKKYNPGENERIGKYLRTRASNYQQMSAIASQGIKGKGPSNKRQKYIKPLKGHGHTWGKPRRLPSLHPHHIKVAKAMERVNLNEMTFIEERIKAKSKVRKANENPQKANRS